MATNGFPTSNNHEPPSEQPGESGKEERPQPLEDELEIYADTHRRAVLFRVPFYKNLLQNYEDAFRKKTREQIEDFNSLKSIKDEDKQRILTRVKHSIAQIQSYQAWREIRSGLDDINTLGWLITAFGLLLGGIVWVHNIHKIAVWWIALIMELAAIIFIGYMLFQNKRRRLLAILFLLAISGFGYIQFKETILDRLPGQLIFLDSILLEASVSMFIITVFVFYLFAFIALLGPPTTNYFKEQLSTGMVYSEAAAWSLKEQKRIMYGIALVTVSIIIIFRIGDTPTPFIAPLARSIILVSLTGSVAASILLLAALFHPILLIQRMENLKITRHPEDEITQTLCYTLTFMESNSEQQWREYYLRDSLVYQLTWIERRIQNNLYKSLFIEPEMRKWLRSRAMEMSASFNKLAQEVILPDKETRGKLIERIAKDLINAADRNWGNFERIKPEGGLPWWTAAFLWLRSALFIAMPFLLIIGVEFLPLGLDETAKTQVIIAAIGLGMVNLVNWVKPSNNNPSESK